MSDLNLYAKNTVTLYDHLLQTLRIAKEITALDLNRKEGDLINAALLASALHDIGKADQTFQDYLFGRKKRANPHPLLALPIVDSIISEDLLSNYYKYIILLAIASHHTPLRSDLYESKHNIYLNVSKREELSLILEAIKNASGINLNINKLNLCTKPTIILNQAKLYLLNNEEIDKNKLREDFVYVQGVLEQADWLASASKDLERASFPPLFIDNNYDYQDKASNTEGNIFIMLPTGSGKTETALYWAKHNYNKSNASRIFYVLPTTTTINAMYLRLQRYFNDNIGEYHSNVDLFLDMERDNSLSDDELLMYKYFLMPINVTTPDQLLLSLMNYKKFTLKSFSMYNSLIIFDEIHTYDAETFAMIKFLLKYLHRYYNTKFCIMSATFPTALKNELAFLHANELISPEDVKKYYESRRRTKLEYKDNLLKDSITEIVEEARRNKRVLVVVNTVKRAQTLYRKLKEEEGIDDILLLHSRYTLKDRYEKEKRLNKHDKLPSILVATQVVEVSLDIDYDIMFTEACYIDSLIQRAGRVNRKGKRTEPSTIYIFKPDNNYPYESKLLDTAINIIQNASNIRSEWDYVVLTNKFYDNIWNEVRVEQEDRFCNIWENLKYIYSVDLSDREIAELLRTRTGIVSIPAFPITFYDKIKELHDKINTTYDVREKEKLYREKRQYLVNVPLIKDITVTHESMGIFVNRKYDSEYGLVDEEDNII